MAVGSDLPQVEQLEELKPNIVTQVFAADGSVLGEFAIEKRVIVRYEDIPDVLRNAIIATEDEIKANPRSRSAKLRWARLAGGTSPCERTGFR